MKLDDLDFGDEGHATVEINSGEQLSAYRIGDTYSLYWYRNNSNSKSCVYYWLRVSPLTAQAILYELFA
jgi:hypothetical protein